MSISSTTKQPAVLRAQETARGGLALNVIELPVSVVEC